MTVISCPGDDGTKPILRPQPMTQQDIERTEGLLVWLDQGKTRFCYELDVAHNSHCYELRLGEAIYCARIRVSTIINGGNLEVTLADLTDERCPASDTRKDLRQGDDKELLSKIVPILESDSEVLDGDSVQMTVHDGYLVVEGSIIRVGERTAAMAGLRVPPLALRPRTVIGVKMVDL